MKALSIKKMYTLHSWIGIITAVLMFIVAFTGALAVLSRPELKIWANEQLHQTTKVDSVKVAALVKEYHGKVPPAFQENIHVYLPTGHNYHQLTLLFEAHDGDENHEHAAAYAYQFHPSTYALENEFYGASAEFYDSRKTDAGSFIGHFHADLHLGRPIGLILTGLLGLTLMVSVVSGLVIHRKYFAELFTFRRKKSFELAVTDAHKVAGLWGSLFHLVIGFTGAFLGLVTVILLPAAAFVGFGGDQDKLVETFTAMPEPVISQVYQPTDIDKIYSDVQSTNPKANIIELTIMAYGDKNAEVYVRTIGGEKVAGQLIKYAGNGDLLKTMSSFGDIPGATIQVLEVLFPLHFGNFAGIFVKILWVFLGLSTALLPLSGMMMWLKKRTRGQNRTLTEQGYNRWNRLIIGSCGGLVLACIALFPLQVILNHFVGISMHNQLIINTFFLSWLFWCFIALLPMSYRLFFNVSCVLAAVLCVMVPILNITFSQSHMLSFTSALVAIVDTSFLLLGLGFTLLVKYNQVGLQAESAALNNVQGTV